MPSPTASTANAADPAGPDGAPSSRPSERQPDLALLVAAARAARANAYAPYSHYAVGAAVLTDDGRLVTGANVENASYGATVCAERVAIWTAVASGARRVEALAVVTAGGGSPCGLCRQVLIEFADAGAPVAMAAPEGDFTVRTVGALLPDAWTSSDLGLRT